MLKRKLHPSTIPEKTKCVKQKVAINENDTNKIQTTNLLDYNSLTNIPSTSNSNSLTKTFSIKKIVSQDNLNNNLVSNDVFIRTSLFHDHTYISLIDAKICNHNLSDNLSTGALSNEKQISHDHCYFSSTKTHINKDISLNSATTIPNVPHQIELNELINRPSCSNDNVIRNSNDHSYFSLTNINMNKPNLCDPATILDESNQIELNELINQPSCSNDNVIRNSNDHSYFSLTNINMNKPNLCDPATILDESNQIELNELINQPSCSNDNVIRNSHEHSYFSLTNIHRNKPNLYNHATILNGSNQIELNELINQESCSNGNIITNASLMTSDCDDYYFLNRGNIDIENTIELPYSFTREVVQSRTTPSIQVQEHYIGKMNVLCSFCRAKHFVAEKVLNKKGTFNDCCSHGEVCLEPLPTPPPILVQLFDGTHELSNHFYDRIRYYNNSFSFASFNANTVDFINRRPGPFCFKIHGQIYYQMNTSLYPAANEAPTFGQLFIVDSNEAIEFRCNQTRHLNENIISAIDNVMRECNIFARSYQMMRDELKCMQESNNGIEPELQLLFTLKPGKNRGRYNFQRTNEVAAVYSTSADGDIPESFVTIRNKYTKELLNISTMDANVEPWIYPLFYPYGTRGWHRDLRCVNKDRRVTRAAYIKYRMAIRHNDYNVFLLGRRLFQQWVVDNYVKIEKDRIFYCKTNQKQLRAESYQGLIDHLQTNATNTNTRVGKMVILPSTFTGSPRNMVQHYQDAMAIVRKYGKPDLFITMTCNPKWREIQENLLSGQTASDRPDLVARVFEIKKDKLINLITKQNIFGEVVAHVYVVEYQKRGLPHVHLLITLKQNSKITCAEVIDKYISTEIPDPIINPRLHDIVMRNMIHGPCGDWCLQNGKCSKHFPKSFIEETSLDENGYPHYRRRNTGCTYTRNGGFNVDNRNVVAYNALLLLTFDCHINVELTTCILAVKYLYKYVFKGPDAASIGLKESPTEGQVVDHDEIQNFIDTRYIGPVEACGRILSLRLQEKSHAIVRLPVHLPNQQMVTFSDDNGVQTIQSASQKQTMLVDYFHLNLRDSEARKFTYSEIPMHYVFKKSSDGSYSWAPRKSKFKVIGRMYSISPTQTELFHLRLLLINVKGATSFINLRTVNNVLHETYTATCLTLGLIEDDTEWKRAMHEAELWMMPGQLRQLFVRIIIYCQPVHPEELWEEFKNAMSEDFSRNLEQHEAHRKAYIQINTLLKSEGSSIERFPTMEQISQVDTDELNEVSHEQHHEISSQQYAQLNEKQKEVVDKIVDSVNNNINNDNTTHSSCFYIDGPGGSGKTFIYTTLFHLLKAQGKNICTMAFTGIAATLLPTGKTVHKTFGMPVPLFHDSNSSIKNGSPESEYLQSIDLFIWDEAPMAPRYALELIDRTLRDIMNNSAPFGGKIVVLGGDFRQLLPVQVNATRSEMINLSIKFSPLWKCFSIFSLSQNMRTLPEEHEFAQFLLNIGDGILNDNRNNIKVPPHCIASSEEDIVLDIYGKIIQQKQYNHLSKSVILSARNVDVEDINKRVVELLDKSTERIYTGIDSVENCDNGDINDVILPEYLNSLNPPNFPPHELKLRINCIIMLVRNLSINQGLCNGTRLQVLELANHLLKCKILTGDKSGEIVFINRITLYCENLYPFTFKRRQFPVKLAFAMTINKSQGQTFEKIGIDLRRDVFNHGQLYVALSRVRSWVSLKIYLNDQRQCNDIKNHVYTELYDAH